AGRVVADFAHIDRVQALPAERNGSVGGAAAGRERHLLKLILFPGLEFFDFLPVFNMGRKDFAAQKNVLHGRADTDHDGNMFFKLPRVLVCHTTCLLAEPNISILSSTTFWTAP